MEGEGEGEGEGDDPGEGPVDQLVKDTARIWGQGPTRGEEVGGASQQQSI